MYRYNIKQVFFVNAINCRMFNYQLLHVRKTTTTSGFSVGRGGQQAIAAPVPQGPRTFIHMFSFTQLIFDVTIYLSLYYQLISRVYLILVFEQNKISQSGVLPTCFSDYFLIRSARKITKDVIGCHNTVTTCICSLKNYSKNISMIAC